MNIEKIMFLDDDSCGNTDEFRCERPSTRWWIKTLRSPPYNQWLVGRCKEHYSDLHRMTSIPWEWKEISEEEAIVIRIMTV
jgi:hypothetical protein